MMLGFFAFTCGLLVGIITTFFALSWMMGKTIAIALDKMRDTKE